MHFCLIQHGCSVINNHLTFHIKGNRQSGSVTSGKGLALRAGLVRLGLRSRPGTGLGWARPHRRGRWHRPSPERFAGPSSGRPQLLGGGAPRARPGRPHRPHRPEADGRLRTGTDRGNSTV